MANSTAFPSFTKLPARLRRKIWKMAIRPVRPAAHKFSIIREQELEPSDPLWRHAVCGPKGWAEHVTHRIAAPSVPGGDPGERSWIKGNTSAYVWDGGLWNACRESREVMTKHFSEQFFVLRPRDLKTEHMKSAAWNKNNGRQSASVIMARRGTEELLFTVVPDTDLFILEPFDWVATICWGLFYDIPFCRFALDRRRKNIAVEFHPSWNVDLPDNIESLVDEPSPRGFVARALWAYESQGLEDCVIWLIDRDIVLPNTLKDPQYCARERFYDCNNEYVEAWSPWFYGGCASGTLGYEQTAIYFAHHMERLDDEKPEPFREYESDPEEPGHCTLGVLGCF